MTFKLGVDQLLESAELLESLQDKRCGIVAHPASITSTLQHSLDALIQNRCPITRAFGPQHGMRGDKQDSSDFF